jgi:NADH-quinone oxidoreductase subunit M
VLVLVSVGTLISAAYSVRTMGRLFTGPVRPRMRNVADLCAVEMTAAGLLAAGIIGFGVAPGPVLSLTAASVARLSGMFAGS